MSSRDPLFQFVWDSIAHGEVELEMDDSTLGIGSLSVRVHVRRYSEMMRGGFCELLADRYIKKLHGLQKEKLSQHTNKQTNTVNRTQYKPSSVLENPKVLSALRLRSQSPSGLVFAFPLLLCSL
ncbi:hypothetical protein ACLB2K_002528 [Fragaria x ananassa]